MHTLLLFLHLIGASIWVGGHLILVFVILPEARRNQSPEYLLRFEKMYERIGMPALFTQLITGGLLFAAMFPTGGFSYDHPLAYKLYIKLGLLLITFAIAIHARFFVLKNLTVTKLPLMHKHVAAVTLVSLLFILAGINFKFDLF
jgi:putative copper export protein